MVWIHGGAFEMGGTVDLEIELEQVLACTIVNVFCNGIEREEDGIEEVCFGIIVCAVVFLNGPC
jgi:hypothetical protein